MAQLSGKSLRCIGVGPTALQTLPTEILKRAGDVTEATLSFNSLASLEGLDAFAPSLETLILDNNALTSTKSLPRSLPKLKTLWLNNNQIANLEETLTVLAARCPALTYLSLLRNPCCPHELTGKNEHEYSRYRVYAKHRIPTLTTVDADPITDQEAATAKERGAYFHTVVAQQPAVAEAEPEKDERNDEQKPVASRWANKSPARPTEAVFSNQRHFYSGKTSEGNRFIGNDML